MGIRYYAYAFDSEMTDQAKLDPRRFISDDPLADAWGMPHGAQVAMTNFEQSVPRTEMLYLDKAWSLLQALTGPSSANGAARSSHRMFEGQVTMDGYGWIPWVRAVSPEEVVEIARDLADLQPVAIEEGAVDRDTQYMLDYLNRAVQFVSGLAVSGRGFVYMIG
nr:hypothetical protein [uncultured Microbacterium sp.]